MTRDTKALQIALVILAWFAPHPFNIAIICYCVYRAILELKSKDIS